MPQANSRKCSTRNQGSPVWALQPVSVRMSVSTVLGTAPHLSSAYAVSLGAHKGPSVQHAARPGSTCASSLDFSPSEPFCLDIQITQFQPATILGSLSWPKSCPIDPTPEGNLAPAGRHKCLSEQRSPGPSGSA